MTTAPNLSALKVIRQCDIFQDTAAIKEFVMHAWQLEVR